MAPIRIIQVTDCHVFAEPGLLYRGADPHDCLGAMLAQVRLARPDILLATGDLSEDASPASYAALKRFFESLAVPVLALPGNHDDPLMLAQTFPGSPVKDMVSTELGVWQIIRLDSCLPGKPEGRLRPEVLRNLELLLASGRGRPRLIALHHQPVPVGSPWIDKYPLLEAEGFLQLVDRHTDVKGVVWGHVHHALEVSRNGALMLAGPSSVANSLPNSHRFEPDSRGPACRLLDLYGDGTLRTEVIRAWSGLGQYEPQDDVDENTREGGG